MVAGQIIRYSKYVMVESTRRRNAPAPRSSAPERREGSLARVAAWMARQVEVALAEVDLSLPQYRILHLLAEGATLPSSLAKRLDVARPSITAVVDGLVARRLVVRETDTTDRRKVTHTITGEGERLLATADLAIDRRLEAVAGALGSPLESQAALAGLERWGPALVAWHEKQREAQAQAHAAPAAAPEVVA